VVSFFTDNTNEPLPEIFYVFLHFDGSSIYDWVNKHNYSLRKELRSSGLNNLSDPDMAMAFISGDIDYLPFVRNNDYVTRAVPSSFVLKIMSNYHVEHELEIHRKLHYKTFPSRLSALYAFGSFDDCMQTVKKYGWDKSKIRRFRLSDLTPFRVVKVNMEIVSLLRATPLMVTNTEDKDNVFDAYWKGQGNITVDIPVDGRRETRRRIDSGTIYEYLIEGVLSEIE